MSEVFSGPCGPAPEICSMSKRLKYNPGQDLADAERAIKRFDECMENRGLIIGDPPDDLILRMWQRRAHSLGIRLSNLALNLDEELSWREDHTRVGIGCSCGRSAYCRKEES